MTAQVGDRFKPVSAAHGATIADRRIDAGRTKLADSAGATGAIGAHLNEIRRSGQSLEAINLRLNGGILVLKYIVTQNFAAEHFTPHPIETVADALVIFDHIVEQDIAGAPTSFLPAPFGQSRTLHGREDRAREGVFTDTLNAGEHALGTQEDGNFLLVLRSERRRGAEVIVAIHRDRLGTLVEHRDTGFLALDAVGLGIGEDRYNLLAEQAALGIPVIDGNQSGIRRRSAIGLHPAGRRSGKSKFYNILVRHGGRSGGKTESQGSRCHQRHDFSHIYLSRVNFPNFCAPALKHSGHCR